MKDMRRFIIAGLVGTISALASPAGAQPKVSKTPSCEQALLGNPKRVEPKQANSNLKIGEVTLLGRPGCSRTAQARKLLEAQGIAFNFVNIDAEPKRANPLLKRFAPKAQTLPVLIVEESTVMDGRNGPYDSTAVFDALRFAKERQELKVGLDAYVGSRRTPSDAARVVSAFARATEEGRKGIAVQEVVSDAVLKIDPRSLAELPAWKLSEKLNSIDGIAGVERRGDDVSVYVRTSSGVRAVTLNGAGVVVEGASRLWAHVREDLKSKSTSEMHLVAFQQGEEGALIHIEDGSSIALSASELSEIEAGRPLPSTHALSLHMSGKEGAFVVFSTPLMQRHDAPEVQFSDRLGSALQRAYARTLVLRDPFSAETKARVSKLLAFDKATSREATALIARDDAVLDYKLVQNIEDELKANGVHVVEFDASKPVPSWSEESGRMVIILSGHSDERLAAFVREMGDAGVFRDNVVLDNSCGTPLTRQLIAEITGRYGGLSAFGYEGKILVKDVQPFLTKIAPAFGATPPPDAKDSMLRFMFNEMRTNNLSGSWVVSQAPTLGGVPRRV